MYPVFDAIILAAGLSSRMDGFKPLLPLAGRTALERCVSLFRDAGAREVLVVTGHRSEETGRAAKDAGGRPVFNPDHEKGMFASVTTGLKALDEGLDCFFLLPVDIPLVRPATIRVLLERFGESGAAAVYPKFLGERGHPPLLSKALVMTVATWSRDGGLRGVLEDLEGHGAIHAHDVDVADEGVLQDMDTADDFRRLVRRAEHMDAPSPNECEAMLRIAGTPHRAAEHGRVVARVACALAGAVNEARLQGRELDLVLVERAALLHDLAKGHASHEALGAAVLREHGFHAIAPLVEIHRDIPPHPERPLDEADMVFMADKLVAGTELVPVAVRYGQVLERHGHDPDARRAIKGRRNNGLAMQHRIGEACGCDVWELASQTLSEGS